MKFLYIQFLFLFLIFCCANGNKIISENLPTKVKFFLENEVFLWEIIHDNTYEYVLLKNTKQFFGNYCILIFDKSLKLIDSNFGYCGDNQAFYYLDDNYFIYGGYGSDLNSQDYTNSLKMFNKKTAVFESQYISLGHIQNLVILNNNLYYTYSGTDEKSGKNISGSVKYNLKTKKKFNSQCISTPIWIIEDNVYVQCSLKTVVNLTEEINEVRNFSLEECITNEPIYKHSLNYESNGSLKLYNKYMKLLDIKKTVKNITSEISLVN